jgi:hypothetical protein
MVHALLTGTNQHKHEEAMNGSARVKKKEMPQKKKLTWQFVPNSTWT